MPLMDLPLKRVAVDLVGPITPARDKGHQYVLTLVDYATRYPEAVPLKNIDIETVAEALWICTVELGYRKKCSVIWKTWELRMGCWCQNTGHSCLISGLLNS